MALGSDFRVVGILNAADLYGTTTNVNPYHLLLAVLLSLLTGMASLMFDIYVRAYPPISLG